MILGGNCPFWDKTTLFLHLYDDKKLLDIAKWVICNISGEIFLVTNDCQMAEMHASSLSVFCGINVKIVSNITTWTSVRNSGNVLVFTIQAYDEILRENQDPVPDLIIFDLSNSNLAIENNPSARRILELRGKCHILVHTSLANFILNLKYIQDTYSQMNAKHLLKIQKFINVAAFMLDPVTIYKNCSHAFGIVENVFTDFRTQYNILFEKSPKLNDKLIRKMAAFFNNFSYIVESMGLYAGSVFARQTMMKLYKLRPDIFQLWDGFLWNFCLCRMQCLILFCQRKLLRPIDGNADELSELFFPEKIVKLVRLIRAIRGWGRSCLIFIKNRPISGTLCRILKMFFDFNNTPEENIDLRKRLFQFYYNITSNDTEKVTTKVRMLANTNHCDWEIRWHRKKLNTDDRNEFKGKCIILLVAKNENHALIEADEAISFDEDESSTDFLKYLHPRWKSYHRFVESGDYPSYKIRVRSFYSKKQFTDYKLRPVERSEREDGVVACSSSEWKFPNYSNAKCSSSRDKKIVVSSACSDYLRNCRPKANELAFLHVISMFGSGPMPREEELESNLLDTLERGESLALLTCKRWPRKICSFPLFVKEYEIAISTKANVAEIELTSEQLETLEKFQKYLLIKAKNYAQKYVVWKRAGGQNDFFVVPVVLGKKPEIAWYVVDDCISCYENNTCDSMVGRIISPKYVVGQHYIVERVLENETPLSKNHTGETYVDHIKMKYKMDVVERDKPPMYDARSVAGCHSIATKPKIYNLKDKVKDEDYNDKNKQKTKLIPELCKPHHIPGEFWFKCNMLPFISSKLQHILLAETLVKRLKAQVPFGNSSGKEAAAVGELRYKGVHYPPRNTSPTDVERFTDQLNHICYVKCVEKFEKGREKKLNLSCKLDREEVKSNLMDGNFLSRGFSAVNGLEYGNILDLNIFHPPGTDPKISDIFQVLCSPECGEISTFQHLSPLGNCLIRFACALACNVSPHWMDRKQPAVVLEAFASDDNLCECSKRIDFPSMVKISNLQEENLHDWCLGTFHIPSFVKACVKTSGMKPFFGMFIQHTKKERFTGELSKENVRRIYERVPRLLQDTTWEGAGNDAQERMKKGSMCSFHMKCVEMSTKTAAEAFKALIGVYFRAQGLEDSLTLLRYFGVVETNNVKSLLKVESHSHLWMRSHYQPMEMRHVNSLRNRLQSALNYDFCDEATLASAIGGNRSFQVLGGCVIDLLLTAFAYEKCAIYEEAEDLKFALTNNHFYALYAVVLGLQTFIPEGELASSDPDDFRKFVRFLQDCAPAGQPLNTDLLLFAQLSQQEEKISEMLSLCFKAVVAAVYYDTGMNLETTWKAFSCMAEREINQFQRNVPKSATRALGFKWEDIDVYSDFHGYEEER